MAHEEQNRLDKIKAYWNERAKLGTTAGTNDIISKQLELEAISQFFRDGLRVLEFGCGNGQTALYLAQQFAIDILGLDYAPAMVEAARANIASSGELRGTVRFDVGDLTTPPQFQQPFDLVYTERALINLEDWERQKEAIAAIGALLRPGGHYVMCENSQDGLDRINELRARTGLPEIQRPWHNVYFRDTLLNDFAAGGLKLERTVPFSATYYFLSRVVNASLAAQEGTAPRYDSPVNRLALALPPIGETAQVKIWLWRKTTETA